MQQAVFHLSPFDLCLHRLVHQLIKASYVSISIANKKLCVCVCGVEYAGEKKSQFDLDTL